MFNKEGIPFFIITIPFLSILFISFFTLSYYLKLSNENFEKDINEYKKLYALESNITKKQIEEKISLKIKEHEETEKKFKRFIVLTTVSILIFMALFSLLMTTIINDLIKKYKLQVQYKENKLQKLNRNLASKVEEGIAEGKRKDKAMLQQSKLARMGSMISMIAHQWRQPLTELSGILMELETATRFKKVNEEHILNSIERSDTMIEFMSNTIDDFRNFYKPDKIKEDFYLVESCKKALSLISATLSENQIKLEFDVRQDSKIHGYPTEFSQVILNLLINATDILIEKKIQNPKIKIKIEKREDTSIIIVSDNAGGIKEKNFEMIFDPYFSTKESSKGTGLGLYISKLIIEKNMGGELSVRNDQEGAVFKIALIG
ncbi:sensor histidine kinase [Arcobacter arenosus]|jgi:signal transduction histidine kinase|uniref:histidine kinase n=1 Tax=Arcobacter arenosus TaxID=2576037 RepID=A0A5R8XZV6_9BACT|nr:HAMP domain-containing sensor histidine kinase [Arcobacter arenosus]TLP37510.1 HAMP domain-containing histidine kinase [Arcobacter arenosus]